MEDAQPHVDEAQIEGGVQSEMSIRENHVFDSNSAQCHAATS
jgi:hypothetical protein